MKTIKAVIIKLTSEGLHIGLTENRKESYLFKHIVTYYFKKIDTWKPHELVSLIDFVDFQYQKLLAGQKKPNCADVHYCEASLLFHGVCGL